MSFEQPREEHGLEYIDAVGVRVYGKIEDGELKIWGFDDEENPLESGSFPLGEIDENDTEAVQGLFEEGRRELYGTKQADINAARRENTGVDQRYGQYGE